MANKKGYKLAHLTYTNLILIEQSEWSKLNIEEFDYIKNFHYEKLTYVISTFGGDTYLSQSIPFSQYMEPSDVGIRKYFQRKYLGADKVSTHRFDSNYPLIQCKIVKP